MDEFHPPFSLHKAYTLEINMEISHMNTQKNDNLYKVSPFKYGHFVYPCGV